MKPKPIEAKVKVVIIGDYRKLTIYYITLMMISKEPLKIRLEYDPKVNNNEANRKILARNIQWEIKEKP